MSANDNSGSSVAAGDFNGDGKADIIIGAYGTNSNAGSVYVVYGGATKKSGAAWASTQTLASGAGNLIDETNGVRFDGVTAGDYLGFSVAAGDVNGDGKIDLLTGAYSASSGAGYGYVVFGKAAAWSATQTLASGAGNLIDGTQGLRFDGVSAGDHAGWPMGAADVNHDGTSDIIMGAWGRNSGTGSFYVILGESSGWPTPPYSNLCTGGGC